MASTTTMVSRPVSSIGYGLMSLCRPPNPPSAAGCEAALDAAMAQGITVWNAGEFYGKPDRNTCHLINEYFTKHPDQADKVVLNIKGCLDSSTRTPDCSPAFIRASVENCLKILDGKKKIDIFEPARLDPNVSLESTMTTLAELVSEGKIGAIGLSEVNAKTIERAHAMHPIASVEAELSIWTPDILHNGVAATCARLGIPIVAYSPLARGALTGQTFRRNADLPEGDLRRILPRFQDDVLEHNNKVTDAVHKLARKKGVPVPQVAIAWVRQLSGRTIQVGKDGETVQLGTIIPIPGATTPERIIENCTLVELTDAEMNEIDEILKTNTIKGLRVPEQHLKYMEL